MTKIINLKLKESTKQFLQIYRPEKRLVIKDIDGIKGKKYENYIGKFDYLISTGITLSVSTISIPIFLLSVSEKKYLTKLYLNDGGVLTSILLKNNIRAILEDNNSLNLGSIYENVVASELVMHDHKLYYYDNKSKGKVDF